MTENFKQENLQSQEKIVDLSEKIEELEKIKQEETARFVYDDKSKKKKKKSEAARLELPEVKELRRVEFVKDEKGKFHFEYQDQNGHSRILTKGDLISDMGWGIYYDLNHEVIAEDYRIKYEKFRQQYAELFYQTKIDRLASMKLALKMAAESTDTFKSDTYRDIYERLKESKEGQSEQAGFLFEKMLEGLLLKVAEDLGKRDDYKFSVQKASVFDDVELKADLIINLPERNRGVGVEEKKKVAAKKGIQVTLVGRDNEKWQHKLEQVRKAKEKIPELKAKAKTQLDDLVLFEVEVGNREILNVFDQWDEHNRPSGGPENFFSLDMTMEFLTEVFRDSELDLDTNQKFKSDLWEYFKAKK
jgi:hypothetical protein